MEEGKEEKITNENLEPEKDLNQEQNIEDGKETNTAKEEIIEENTTETSMIEVKSKKGKKNKKVRKGSYITGTIGAILGGIVAALPWILVYMLANNMVIPMFAILIPLGAYLGYKIFIGKKGKPFPVIISIISLLIIILTTTIICPIYLLLESSYTVNIENILGLYSDTRAEIRKSIIEDSVAGIAFAIIGIILVIKAFIIKKKTLEEKILLQQEKQNRLKEQSQIIKNAFLDLNSMSKENTTKKKQILKQLTRVYNVKKKKAKLYFVNCKINKLIKKHKGKYYYNETNEKEKIENVRKLKNKLILKKVIILLVVIAFVIGAVSIALYIIDMNKELTLAGTNIVVEIDKENQDYYGTAEEITNKFGEQAASICHFVLTDKAGTYEVNGQAIPATQYAGQDFASIIQEDRDYYATNIIGEEATSQIEDKQIAEQKVKSYHYDYTGMDGNQYRAAIYLCEADNYYVWINVYADYEVDFEQIDKILDKFIK